MKEIIRTLVIFCAAFLATVLVGCENTKGNTNEKVETFNILLDDEAKEYGISKERIVIDITYIPLDLCKKTKFK